jgi:ribosomal protein S18 acetylase RimI-like enzyme
MATTRQAESGLTIRLATAADVIRIIALANAAFAIETFIDGTRTDAERMAEMMRKGDFLVAVDQGQIIASVYTEKRGDRGYFGMLAVDPSRQGSGLGRRMAEAAEDHCRSQGCTHMDIVVLSLRPELPPLYRKLGYVETGTEEFRPSRPLKGGAECHGIIMSKAL